MALSNRSARSDATGAYFGADTSADAEVLLVERYRQMTPIEKLQKVAELNGAVRILAEAGIRLRYGSGISARERFLRLASLRLDRRTMIEAYGWDPEVEGY
jgi:hypothetical protein